MNIKDCWKVIKDSYLEINKDKIEAKKILKNKQADLIVQKTYLDYVKKANKYLSNIYLCLDENERKICVQDTLDLLNYGPKDKEGKRSWRRSTPHYEYLYNMNIYYLESAIELIKEYIKKGQYKEVIENYSNE